MKVWYAYRLFIILNYKTIATTTTTILFGHKQDIQTPLKIYKKVLVKKKKRKLKVNYE